MALLDGLRGANMLTADLEAWRRKLLESPWVADAAIRRVFPGTVAVAITERQPLGIGRISDSLYLVDSRGIVIDEYGPNYAEFDLPIIDGLRGARGRRPAARRRDRARRWPGVAAAISRPRPISRGGCRRSTSPTLTTPC